MNAILEATSEELSKKRSAASIRVLISLAIFSLILIIATIIAIPDKKSVLYLGMITVGILGLAIFLIKLLSSNGDLVYIKTGSNVKSFSLYFKPDELPNLMYAIETVNVDVFNRLFADTNSGIRLDVVLSKDDNFAACQIFKFIPYNYEPVSVVYKIQSDKLSTFCGCMRTLHAK